MTASVPKKLPQLIASLSDGSIGPDEMEQLNEQLRADPIAMEAYLDHMELDAMLEREFGGLVDEVVPQSTTSFVRRALLSVNSPETGRRALPTSFFTRRFVLAAVAAVVLMAVGIFVSDWLRSSIWAPSATNQPLIVQSTGGVELRCLDGSSLPVTVGQSVSAGTTVTTIEDAGILLRYGDGTQIAISASTSLELGESAEEGKRLELQHGLLYADVVRQPADQPLIITTPQTQVRVLGTRFELSADDEAGTRLDLERGRVELVRDSEPPVVIESNSIAVVRSADEPIRITPRPTVIAAPDREAQFPGVHSFDFSPDGRSLVAVQGHGGIVYWHDDDKLETIHAADGAESRVVARSGSMIAFEVHEPRQLVIWDITSRQAVHVIDDMGQLPAAFKMASGDPGPVTKKPFPFLRITLLSPRSDWIAVHSRGSGTDALHVLDFSSGRTTVIERNNLMIGFQVSPDGSTLAIGQSRGGLKNSGVVELVSASTGESLASLLVLDTDENKLPGVVHSKSAFSPDGSRLGVSIRGRLQVWDVASGQRLAEIKNVGDLRHVALSPDGEWIAGACSDGAISLWKVDDPSRSTVLERADHCQSLNFSPDGQRVAALMVGGRLWVWDLGKESQGTRPK